MFIDFNDIQQRYLQLYLLEYPENRNEETRKTFLTKYIHKIKADLLKQSEFYAKRANESNENVYRKVSDIEFFSIQAFTELIEILKQ